MQYCRLSNKFLIQRVIMVATAGWKGDAASGICSSDEIIYALIIWDDEVSVSPMPH